MTKHHELTPTRIAVTTDKAVDLAAVAAELGDGVVLSCLGLPGVHEVTGVTETCTVYLDPASPVKVTQAKLDAAVQAHSA